MKIRAPSHVLATEVQGEAVLLNLKTDNYYSLDEVGSRMWALLVEFGRVEPAVGALVAEYDVSEDDVRRDLADLLQDLVAQGLLLTDEE